jgi:hypothetical protein
LTVERPTPKAWVTYALGVPVETAATIFRLRSTE